MGLLLSLVAIIAQEQPPPGNGWQGWVFLAALIGVPIILARILSRSKK